MSFNSLQFIIFLPFVVAVYYCIPNRFKNLWLLLASYYFYSCWNAKYVLLLLFTTLITYGSGLLLERISSGDREESRKKRQKKTVVAVTLFLTLSTLFYFKYFNFALTTIQTFMSLFHIQLYIPTYDIVLPVGISFFTFQALSYTIDVYRKDIRVEKDFCRFALFVSFFPQLVAGPIERSKNLLIQLETPKKFDFERAKDGLLQMIWGFFLKIMLADRIAIFVDTVYGQVGKYSGWYLILATMLFGFQIYCDLYGYSSIACGAAEILGVHLMENFDAPFLSQSVGEFWKRWHISLTSWFKDYVYIPLGGSRKGKNRKYINRFTVFILSGLWHGASFTYVVWGGMYALFQTMGEVLKPVRDKIIRCLDLHTESFGHRLLRLAMTFALINFNHIFFRAQSLKEAGEVIYRIATASNPWILFDGSLYQCGLERQEWSVLLACLLVLFYADLKKYRGVQIRKKILQQDAWFQIAVVVLSICTILTFGIWGPEFKEANFIYFQF